MSKDTRQGSSRPPSLKFDQSERKDGAGPSRKKKSSESRSRDESEPESRPESRAAKSKQKASRQSSAPTRPPGDTEQASKVAASRPRELAKGRVKEKSRSLDSLLQAASDAPVPGPSRADPKKKKGKKKKKSKKGTPDSPSTPSTPVKLSQPEAKEKTSKFIVTEQEPSCSKDQPTNASSSPVDPVETEGTSAVLNDPRLPEKGQLAHLAQEGQELPTTSEKSTSGTGSTSPPEGSSIKKKKSRRCKKIRAEMNDPKKIIKDILDKTDYKVPNLSLIAQGIFLENTSYSEQLCDEIEDLKYPATVKFHGDLMDKNDNPECPYRVSVLPEGFKGKVNTSSSAIMSIPCMYKMPKQRPQWRRGKLVTKNPKVVFIEQKREEQKAFIEAFRQAQAKNDNLEAQPMEVVEDFPCPASNEMKD